MSIGFKLQEFACHCLARMKSGVRPPHHCCGLDLFFAIVLQCPRLPSEMRLQDQVSKSGSRISLRQVSVSIFSLFGTRTTGMLTVVVNRAQIMTVAGWEFRKTAQLASSGSSHVGVSKAHVGVRANAVRILYSSAASL